MNRLKLTMVSLVLGVLLSPIVAGCISYQSSGSFVAVAAAASLDACPKGQCIIDDYINPAIKTLAAIVGVAVTISIVVGGIQYASSGDDPQKVSAAKSRIIKALLTLIGFFFLFAFLNYIIPGGI